MLPKVKKGDRLVSPGDAHQQHNRAHNPARSQANSAHVQPGSASATDYGYEEQGIDGGETQSSELLLDRLDQISADLEPGEAVESGEFAGAVVLGDSGDLGIVNSQYTTDYVPEKPGLNFVGDPYQLSEKLSKVGYQCLHYLAVQIGLLLNTPSTRIRGLLLEGPSGCGKSFMAKSLAKITGAELMCLSCYKGMLTQNLVEAPSTLAMANAMTGRKEAKAEELMNLGIISRAFLKSQEKPIILLIDELDKPDSSIDTFFLGPIQDARIWLESRGPIDANPQNLLIIFTKNFNRPIDEALLRRCHPIKMTYLDSTLERKILSPYCHPQLVANLVNIADRMRNSGGSYAFERPPAPEELLTAGLYVTNLIQWKMTDFGFVGKNLWAMISKSEHDRAVLEHMLRFHPDFMDPLVPDGKNATVEDIQAKLGRMVLDKIIDDPDALRRERAWKELEYQ